MISNIKFRNLYKRARVLKILGEKNNQYEDKDSNLKNLFNIFCDTDYSTEKFFNFPKDEVNFIIRQKILANCGLLNLVKKFIDAGFLNKTFFAPIPIKAIKQIDKIVKVNKIYCKILWFIILFKSILLAFAKVIFYFFNSILPDEKIKTRSVFFFRIF